MTSISDCIFDTSHASVIFLNFIMEDLNLKSLLTYNENYD